MKKMLLMSIFAVSVCFADESYAEHERKMNQMQKETGKGSMNQERNSYEEKKAYKEQKKSQYKNENTSSSSRGDSSRGGSRGGARH